MKSSFGVLVGTLACIASTTLALAQTHPRQEVLVTLVSVHETALFVANADGSGERPLVPHTGIEYSPSVSRDGEWVVFTQETAGSADLYRVRFDGTGLERLTDHPSFDDQGTLSPDGKTLAFVSTRGTGTANIWLKDLGAGTYTTLTNNEAAGNFRPAWSPNGEWLVFSSDRDTTPLMVPSRWEQLQSTGIYIVRPDGTGLRRLTERGGVAGTPRWSPDGKWIVFYEMSEVDGWLARTGDAPSDLVSINIETGERRLHMFSPDTKLSPHLLSGGRVSYYVRSAAAAREGLKVWYPDRREITIVNGAIRQLSWSPNEQQVVYERLLGMVRSYRGAESKAGAEVPRRLQAANNSESIASFPALSPDGKSLLDGVNNGAARRTTNAIRIMNPDGGNPRILFSREDSDVTGAVWSPSGDSIAFGLGKYFRTPGSPSSQIAVINSDGSGFQVVADEGLNNGFPSWSPDGRRLVYRRGRQLAIVTLADKTITPLTEGAHNDNFPQWSPNGDVIMFTSDRDGDYELYTIRSDGTGVRRLTNVAGQDAHSTWSPDGEWILFSSGRKGFKDESALFTIFQPYGEIFVMRADGSDVRQLTDNKWEDGTAAWMPATP